MRVGIFTDTYYPEVNGVATSAYMLKTELEKNGNEVFIFTVTNPKQAEKEENVFRVPSIPFMLFKERRVGLVFSRKWYRIIFNLKLDVIHTQTEFSLGQMGYKAAKMFNIPHIHTYHTIYEDYTHYLKVPGHEKLKWIVKKISEYYCDKADLVIVPTEKVKYLLLDYGVKKPITVQPTGVDLSKFQHIDWDEVDCLKNKYCLDEKMHILVCVGRISQEKNIDEIIENIETLVRVDENLRLLIVGDGPQKKRLEEMVNNLCLKEFVIFTGEVKWTDIQNYYALGDVFVSASTSETQGLTYDEALAAGKPILVRKDDSLRGLLCQGENGFAYETKEEFMGFYELLFSEDNIMVMGYKARKSVECLSMTSFGRNVENIYMNLLQNVVTNSVSVLYY